jgi:hypothetical protein
LFLSPQAAFVFADQQLGVGQIHMWRQQVVRRWLVLEHPAGHVEGGAMAGAQEPPFQSAGSEGCGPATNLSGGAAQVGTDAHDHQDFRLDGARFVLRIGGVNSSG